MTASENDYQKQPPVPQHHEGRSVATHQQCLNKIWTGARMTKLSYVGLLLGLLVAALYFLIGPRFMVDDVYGPDGPHTKAAVLKVVPGSRIDTARTIMEAKGFHCQMLYNAAYADEHPVGGRRRITYPPADILWCDSGERAFRGIFITKRWQVVFVVKDDAVASIAVGEGLTGP
jgi:hypothetical protein